VYEGGEVLGGVVSRLSFPRRKTLQKTKVIVLTKKKGLTLLKEPLIKESGKVGDTRKANWWEALGSSGETLALPGGLWEN